MKQNLLVAVIAICVFAAVMNLPVLFGVLNQVVTITLPVIAGAILALFISVPMKGVKKLLNSFFDSISKKPSPGVVHGLSVFITLVCVIFIVIIVLTRLIPELVQSTQNVYAQLEQNLPIWYAYVVSLDFNSTWVEEALSYINIEQILQQLSDIASTLLPNIADLLSSTIKVTVTGLFAIIFAIYFLLEQEQVCRHLKKCVLSFAKPNHAKAIIRFCRVFGDTFARFLSAQCGEAVILGVLMCFAFTLFGLPYASLVGILTAACAIIPYLGAFISCFVSILLTLLLDPSLVVKCAIVYLVIQFIESQLIYPRVVGGYVGLSPLYTLIAALVGGNLFGIVGILFFIPLLTVVIELVKEFANEKQTEKASATELPASDS